MEAAVGFEPTHRGFAVIASTVFMAFHSFPKVPIVA